MTDHVSPADLAMVPVENVHPSPLQPRTTVCLGLVTKLAESMRAGRHNPILEVEPLPDRAGHYRIVCGEQRWRAAKEAGLQQILVRVHQRLGSLQRLQKQYEENRLRADLTPVEDAQLVLLAKARRDIEVAEGKLTAAGVPFEPLDDARLTEVAQVHEHLAKLMGFLLDNGVNLIKRAHGPAVGPLSPWHETERALGISEAARKAKLSVLRLEPEVLEEVNGLPAQHAPLIASVEGRGRRTELAERAQYLTHRQLKTTVNRLRRNPELAVTDAIAGGGRPVSDDPLASDALLVRLSDVCRQLVRLTGILRSRVTREEHAQVGRVLADVVAAVREFEEGS